MATKYDFKSIYTIEFYLPICFGITMSKTFNDLIADALLEINEIYPWDVEEQIEKHPDTLLLDVRERDEYDGAFIENSILAPRGILEQCCEWNYAETIPELVRSRYRPVVVICRSGNRSVLAAKTMKILGYENLMSLKTGVKGWNDADMPLINKAGEKADPDWAEGFLTPFVSDEQLSEKNS